MIEKLKTLTKIGEEVQGLKGGVRDLSITIEKLHKDISKIKETVSTFTKTQEELSGCVEKNTGTISGIQELNRSLKDEIYDFKLLKSEIRNRIMSHFDKELRKELDNMFGQFRSDAKQYSDLRKDIDTISMQVKALTGEIEKFNSIAKGIKSRDFALVQHKKNLDSMDKEKLMLLKRIDGLERLVSKLRRSKR